MSYCVNCGVELDKNLGECSLCNTPVINPKELKNRTKTPSFPEKKGQVEVVKRKDLGILMTIVAVATAGTCGLLNLFFYDSSPWSLLIIGACALFWVMLVPLVIYTKLPVYVYLLFDGVIVGVYLYLISYMTPSRQWFWGLALPITVLATMVAELFALCVRLLPVSFLTMALYIITAIGLFCSMLELLIDLYIRGNISLTWSAVVMTVCIIVDIMLVTLLSRKRLRGEVRRRLHF